MARSKIVHVITIGVVVYGTYTNLLAAHTRIKRLLAQVNAKSIPSYSTVYRNFKSIDGPVGFETSLGRFVITKSRLLMKGY